MYMLNNTERSVICGDAAQDKSRMSRETHTGDVTCEVDRSKTGQR